MKNIIRTLKSIILVFTFLCIIGYANGQTIVNMTNSNTIYVDVCTSPSGTIYDDGGVGSSYSNGFDGWVVLTAPQGVMITLSGTYNTESCCDKINIYDGEGESGNRLVDNASGSGSINVSSQTGYMTVKFHTDGSVTYGGLELNWSISGTGMSCNNEVDDLVVSNITTTSADLSWSAVTTTDSFYVYLNNSEYFVTTTNSLSLTNLRPNTYYDITVVGVADIGSGCCYERISFRTPCNNTMLLPYAENFDNYDISEGNVLPNCWTKLVNFDMPEGEPHITHNASYTGDGSLYLYCGSNDAMGHFALAITPYLSDNDISQHYIRFKLKSPTANTVIEVGICDDTTLYDNNFTPISSFTTTTSNTWQDCFLPLSSYSGNGRYIAFRMIRRQQNGNGRIAYIDNLVIENCGITSPRLVNRNFNTLAVEWNTHGNPLVNVEMGPEGFLPGTGTMYNNVTSPLTVSNLEPATDYEFHVYPICTGGAVNGEQMHTLRARTLENPIYSLNYCENFDIYSNDSYPEGWRRLDMYSNTPRVYYNSIQFRPYYAQTRPIAVMPAIDSVDFSSIILSFDYKMDYLTSILEVGIMEFPTSSESFVVIDTISPTSTSYRNTMVKFDTYSGNGKYIAFRVSDPNNYYAYVYVDNIKVSTCHIAGARVNNVGTTRLTVLWDSIGSYIPSDSVRITYGPSEHFADSSITITLSVSEFDLSEGIYSKEISGLRPNTNYTIYVEGVCRNIDNPCGIAPINALTLEQNYTLPFCENFDSYENYGFLQDWHRPSRFDDRPYTSTRMYIGSASLNMYAYGDLNYNHSTAVLPYIEFDTLQNKYISFWGYGTRDVSYIEVGVMTEPNDESTFEVVKRITLPNGSWKKFVADFASYTGNGNYIALRYYHNCNRCHYEAWIDEISISNCQIHNIRHYSTNTRGTTIAWDTVGSYSGVVIEFGPNNFVVGTGTKDTIFNQTTFTIDTLSPGTTYDYVIYSLCQGGNSDCISTRKRFTTLETALEASYCYGFEDFPDVSYPYPETWTAPLHCGAEPRGERNGYEGTWSLYFRCNSWNSANDRQSMAVMPLLEMDDLSNISLSFYAKGSGNENTPFVIGNMTIPNDMSTFVPIDTFYINHDDYRKYTVDLSSHTNLRHIAFWHYPVANTSAGGTVYVDNLLLSSCNIENIRTTLTTTTSTVINFDTISFVDSVDMEYGPRGFSLGTGRRITNISSPYTLTGLTPGTAYSYYLLPHCTYGNGICENYSGTFTTISTGGGVSNTFCGDFENVSEGGLPSYWQRVGSLSTSYPRVSSSPYNINYPNSEKALCFQNNSMIVLPIAMQSLEELIVSFDVVCRDSYYPENSMFVVGVMTNPSNASTFEPLDTIISTYNYSRHSISLSSYQGIGRYVAIKNIDSHYRQNSYIDNISTSTCTPINIETSRITANSLQLSWNRMSYTDTTIILYDTLGGNMSANGIMIRTNDTTVSINNLLEGKTYQFYVYALCQDDMPRCQYASLTATTLPISNVVPACFNFDSEIIEQMPSYWTRPYGSIYPRVYSNSYHSASQSLEFYLAYEHYNPMAVMPFLETSNLTSDSISMSLNVRNQHDGICYLIIGTMTNPNDSSTFTYIDTLSVSNNWEAKQLMIPVQENEEGIYIAFKACPSNGNTVYVDDIAIRECDIISARIHRPTTESLDVSWVGVPESAGVKIEYSVVGSLDEEFSGSPDTVVYATQSPFTLSGLEHSTYYRLHIYPACDSVSDGCHYRSYSGQTLHPPVDIPYCENFDAFENDGYPNNWRYLSEHSNCNPHITTSTYQSEQGSLELTALHGYSSYAIMPSFNAECEVFGSVYVLPYIKCTDTAGVKLLVGYMTDIYDTNSFVVVDTIDFESTTDWVRYLVVMHNFNKSTMNVAFKMVSNNQYHKFCYIDDLCIEQCLSTNLQITDITQTTATITWDSQGLENLQCEYGPSGFTPGSGTIIQLTESPYTITGLTEGENYDFLFANLCACDIVGHSIIYGGGYVGNGGYGGGSYGGGGISITTQYPSALLPYCENFEEYEINEIPNHWIRISGSSREYPAFTTSNRHSERASLEFYTQAGSSCYAVLPTLGTDEISDAVMTFYAYSSNSYATGDNARFYVGLVDNPNNPNSFDTIQTISLNSTSQWQKFIVDFSSYTGSGSYIAFKFSPFGNSYSMFIDDLYLSTCALDNVQVIPNGNQVQVSWTEVQDVSSVSITYCPQGTDPNGIDAVTEIASNSPVVIDNLESNHGYDFYITPQCSDTIVAECISNLITINHHTNIPYCENFDGYLDNTIPSEWKVVNSRHNSGFPKVETINGERVFTFYPSSGDNYDMILFPPLSYGDSLNGKYVHLKMEVDNYSRSSLEIGVLPDTNDSRSFVQMANIQPTANNTIQEFVVRLSGYNGTSNRLAIRASVTSGTHWFRTDEFSITDTPYPTNVRVNQPSISTTEILWNKVYDSVYYNILYTTIGSDEWVMIESDSCKAILTNLLPDTTYKYVLQSRNGEIVECTERTFTTEKYRDLPYCDDFDRYEQYACPDGWSRISNDANYPRVLNSYGINGSKALDFYGTATPQIFVLPEFDVDSIQFLTLNCQIYSQGYYNYHGVIVGVMRDRNDANTFIPVDTLLHTTDYVYEKRSVSFKNYQGYGKNIALKYFYNNNRSRTTNIDNLVVKSCPNVIFSANDGNSIKAEIAQNISPDYFVNIHSADFEYDTLIHVQANPYYIDNLASNTKYYISTQCDSLIESCDAPITITTPQIKSLPYCEDFSSYNNNRPPTGWVNYRDGNYNINDYPYKNGNNHIQFYGYSSITQYLIMPVIEVDSIRKAELNFNMWSDNYNYTCIVVGVVTNQYDVNTFVPIDTIWNSVSSAWQNYNVSFLNYQGNGKFIAFKGINTRNSWYSWYIDDLKISSCPKPKIELRDYNTIVFTIDSSYTPNYWIEYGAEGLVQGSTDSIMNEDSTYTVVPNGTLIHVTENPFYLIGLDENTTYTIYTRCDSAIYTCLPATNIRTSHLQSLPYCEDFSSYSNYTIPTGWVNYRDGNYNVNDYPYRTNYPEIRFYGYSSTTQYFIMPSVNIDSIKHIDLYFDMYSDNYNYTSIIVGVMTNQYDINTFVPIKTLRNTISSAWQNDYHVSFRNYQGEGRFIAFKGINNSGSWRSWYIDNLKISSCPTPDVQLYNYNTVVFRIDSNYTADYWVEYGYQGLEQGDSSTMVNEDSTITEVPDGTLIHVTENPFYLTDLDTNTTYSFYTRCDSAIYTCLPSTDIKTLYLPESIPYCENFESYDNNSIPEKWYSLSTTTNSSYANFKVSTSESHTTNKSLRYECRSNNQLLSILPQIGEDSINGLTISLYLKTTNDYGYMEVGYTENPHDFGSFVPVKRLTNTNSEWQRFIISMQDAPTEIRYMAIRAVSTSSSRYYAYIDDIYISNCGANSFEVLNISSNSVTFDWVQVGNPIITIEYGAPDFIQGSGTMVSINSLPPFTISGLNNLTDYKFIFNAECIQQPENYCHPNYADSTTLFTPAGGTGCIDPTDFTSTNTTLTYGVYNNPHSNEGIMDYGYLDSRSRHTVHYDTTEFDSRTGNLLKTVPYGAEASVRLGNWESNMIQPQGESITYALFVDTSSFDLLILKYAAVLQDPLHDPTEQPRFTLEILDENMNLIDPECSAADFIADRNLGWNMASNGVLWKDWTIVGVDMTEFADQIVYIRLTTRDCGEGSHYGYAYFTLNCMMKNIRTEHCGNVESNIFSAPDGFNYRWYSSSDTMTTISTEQSITIEIDNKTYYCECSFTDNPSCKFTVSAYNGTRYPLAQFNQTSRFNNCRYEVNFTNTSTVSADGVTPGVSGERCETAYWDFGNGEISTSYHASTVYTEPGEYIIRLISGIANDACLDTITDTIVVNFDTIRPTIVADSNICKGDSATLTVHNALSLHWNTEDIDSIIYKSPISTTEFTCYVTNLKGCLDTLRHTINVHPHYYYYDTITYCRDGRDFQWRDTILSSDIETGDYRLIRTSEFGCDSNFYLHLLVYSPIQIFDTTNICQNDLPFYWHDTIFSIGTTTGTYVRNHISQHGCDSICYLHLIVDTNPHSYFSDTILQNQLPYIWAGHTFLDEGIFTDTIDISTSCDSIITYSLYVHRNVSTMLDSSICENYLPLVWNGVTFNSTKDTAIILVGNHGVDSSVYMNVTVLQNTTSIIHDTILENQLPWNYQGVNFSTDITDTIFRITNTVGCDSIITYSLYVLRNVSTSTDSSICENYLPLVWNDILFTSTKDTIIILPGYQGVDSSVYMSVTVLRNTSVVIRDTILENQLPWNYLGVEFTTNITDTTLIIPNEAGCDSIITYSLYVHRNVSTMLDSSICENYLPLVWNGVTFNSTKDTTIVLIGNHGVDSSVYMNVTVLRNTTSIIHDTILENQLPWRYLGVDFVTDITDTTFIIPNTSGCDSIITYSLYVYRNVSTTIDSSICENYLPLVWNGVTFNTSGDTSVVLRGIHGVDSTIYMNVTVFRNTSVVKHDTIIENQLPWIYLGEEFSTDITDTTLIIPNAAGCDSIITYSLYVHRNVSTILDSSICENYLPLVWNGVTFNSTKDTTIVLIGNHGIDSSVHMHVTVLQNTTATIHDSIIENQLPWSYLGIEFTTDISDTTFIIPNTVGCDSIITYSLHVHRNVTTFVDTSVCENFLPFIWNGVEFNTTSSRSVLLIGEHGIDSTVNMNVTVLENTTATRLDTIVENQLPWNYLGTIFTTDIVDTTLITQNVAGCDSIITYSLHVYRNVYTYLDSSVCENKLPLIWNGIEFNTVFDSSAILIGEHGVDSIVNMSVSVIENPTATIHDTIIENQLPWTYLGVNFTTDISDTTFVIPNASDCDSLINYNLHVRRNVSTSIDSSTCENYLPLVWNGVTFNTSGDTSVVLVGKHGVDSTVNMNVTVLQNTRAVRYDTIIENQLPWNYLGFNFTDDITDTTLTTQNVAGCDSIITYSLHVYRNVYTYLDSSVCENKLPLIWNGIEFNRAFDSSAILIGEHGVDSIVSMRVSVVENPTATIHDTIIENQLPWTYLGVEFRTDVSDTTFVVPNTSGCDSLITYNLYVHWNSTTILDSSICENNLPLIWNGIEFNSSSDSSVVLIGRYGVDSIVNMHVTVLQNSTAIISDTVLENQLPHRYLDIIFTTDIDTTLIIPNAVGCDSIISYSLHVNRNIYIELDSAVCENNLPFVWYGVEFNSAGDTIVTVPVRNIDGIDSVITLHVDILPTFSSVDDVYLCYGDSLIWIDGNTYYSNTNEPIFILEASNGCDSIINLHLRVDEGKIVSRMKVSPTMVTHEQRMIDLVDLSEYSSDRIWVLPDMVSTNKICRYEYPIDKDSVEITLIAYNEHECSDTSRTIVRMDGDIFVPNAFTPNMESNNKFFVVTKNINSINVRIYDRNGGFIYQYNTLDGEWDGRRNGQVCPQGSYVYRIEYTTKANPNELKTRIGTVTLLR